MARTPVDAYVLDTLMPDLVRHDRRPGAFLVYLHLVHRTGRARSARASLREIAADTGLSKTAVQHAVRTLVRRRLLRVDKAFRTAVPEYTVLRPWIRRSHP
ncbi:MAG TPA: helix-turn-helix domain-containing protein [Vicinamibacterales bacterium]|nr:helix-turn-helix domain-containing protein [Vicinamibacterales bacterium]